jgi:mono/diheme cytochrome c family protein
MPEGRFEGRSGWAAPSAGGKTAPIYPVMKALPVAGAESPATLSDSLYLTPELDHSSPKVHKRGFSMTREQKDRTQTPAHYVSPPQDCRFREFVKAASVAIGIGLPVLIIGAAMMYVDFADNEAIRIRAQERQVALDRLRAAPPLEILPASDVISGRQVYSRACAACHSPTGRGVPGLGPDLVDNWFVALLDDSELHKFVKEGRPADAPDNVTRVPMPPMGGHELNDEDLAQLVAYMRVVQDPRRMPELPEGALADAPPPPPTDDEQAWFLAAAEGDEEQAMYIAHGARLYATSCAACHARDGRGIAGTGTTLINSDFVNSLDDDGLLAFLKRGRDPGDPENVTGVGMPARGGNPALDDDDLLDIIDYVRALQRMNGAAE